MTRAIAAPKGFSRSEVVSRREGSMPFYSNLARLVCGRGVGDFVDKNGLRIFGSSGLFAPREYPADGLDEKVEQDAERFQGPVDERIDTRETARDPVEKGSQSIAERQAHVD